MIRLIVLFLSLVLIGMLLTLMVTNHSHGQGTPQATLSWNPNPEPDIAGYRVYESLAAGNYTNPKVILQPTNTSVQMFLPVNRCSITYYWTVTAFNWNGEESLKSIEVKKMIQGTQYWIGACKKS